MHTRDASGGGLRSQLKPTFMAPAVGMSLFGGLLSPAFSVVSGTLHALAVASALYVAHLVDEYVDAHVRGEESPRVPRSALRVAVVVASLATFSLVGLLWGLGHGTAAALTLPLWVLAVLHAPYLDRHPLSVTADYAVGIGFVVVGGYTAQTPVASRGVVGTAVVLAVVLAGVKISVDRLDVDFDRRVDKRTLPVVLGERRAARTSALVCLGAGVVVAALVGSGVYPVGALLVVPLLGLVAWAGLDGSADRATRRQMLMVYPVAVVLFVTQCLAVECVLVRRFVPTVLVVGGG